MSAGAAIVGAFFGFDLVYIDEDWTDDIKRGVPGTERLVVSKNPFDVFGDLDMQTAHQLFNFHDYGAAMRIYSRLMGQVSDPRLVEIEHLLAESYAHWNAFNFGAASKKLSECRNRAAQYSIKLPAGVEENAFALQQLQEVNLDTIPQEKQALHVIADLYANALRKARTGQFEDAIARLYRCLELMSQSRLASHGISTSSPELASYSEAYKELTLKVYGREVSLPNEIGLKTGYLLLNLMNDALVEGQTIESLQAMFGAIRARDTSITAHGLRLAGQKVFNNLNEFAKSYFQTLCKVSGREMDELVRQHTFVTL
jgi:CRISPR-associated protein (TIGR02710 family)